MYRNMGFPYRNITLFGVSLHPYNGPDHMIIYRFRKTKCLSVKMLVFSYPSLIAYVLGAQKNRLNETVLLSTHNICIG